MNEQILELERILKSWDEETVITFKKGVAVQRILESMRRERSQLLFNLTSDFGRDNGRVIYQTDQSVIVEANTICCYRSSGGNEGIRVSRDLPVRFSTVSPWSLGNKLPIYNRETESLEELSIGGRRVIFYGHIHTPNNNFASLISYEKLCDLSSKVFSEVGGCGVVGRAIVADCFTEKGASQVYHLSTSPTSPDLALKIYEKEGDQKYSTRIIE